ncbi:hypothetical protein RJ639_006257 [Escallonia herrerae]|uniref:Uncharacterized protein n=1 Tax=Escallonia herrerae TaxID=1293975 RepID=A0AA88W4L7_9ASTE|nr:hypothetical protein RJ639_006257 [Escallonia herrerae]
MAISLMNFGRLHQLQSLNLQLNEYGGKTPSSLLKMLEGMNQDSFFRIGRDSFRRKESNLEHLGCNTSQLQTITSQAIFQSMGLRLPDVENILLGEIPSSISNSLELAIIEFSSKLFRGIVPVDATCSLSTRNI